MSTQSVLTAGPVTFLFTDIEGSTSLWERHPEAMKHALARHDALLRAAVEGHHGQVVKSTGDGAYAVFAAPSEAVAAALAFQRALLADPWPELAPDVLRARLGVLTGQAELRDGDYFGPTLNRTARIMSIGHGAQILLGTVTAHLVTGGLPPGVSLLDLGEHRLRDLTQPEHIFQVVAEGLPARFPALRTSSARVVNLPGQPTGFIGRWDEVDGILRLLAPGGSRLVTLVGPGGMGKTRLGIQAAATLAEREPERFRDGIHFVPFAPLRSAESMVGAIAAALDFQFGQGEQGPRRELLDYLRGREALLVLDNLEHLLDDGGATLLADILDTAPGVSMLATSRSRLSIQGEQLYVVPGMSLPDAQEAETWSDPQAEAGRFSGLRLFLQAAGRARPDFRLTPDNVAAVVRVCRQVQGMPLGIEMAAGWLELLSPAEISAEIARSLDVLATDLYGVPERQRSMRAVFDSTWQLLSERERTVLPALSVFRASFTREAAEAVAGAGLRDLMSLANKTWLQPVSSAGGSSRFQMHELLRQYAEEKLRAGGEAETAANDRYARYYAALWAENGPRLESAAQKEALALLTREYLHGHAAWTWLVARGELEWLADRMLRPFVRFALMHSLIFEVGDLVRQALDACRRAAGCHLRVRISLLVAVSALRYPPSDPSAIMDEAHRLVEDLAEPERELGIWYPLLLNWRPYRDPDNPRRLWRLAEGDDTDGRASLAAHLTGAALLAESRDRTGLEESVEWLRRAAAGYLRRGDRWAYAGVIEDLSLGEFRLGNRDSALALVDEAQAIYESLADWHHANMLRQGRATTLLYDGRPDLVLKTLEGFVAYSRERGDRLMETFSLGFLSLQAVRFGDLDETRRMRERALALTRELGYSDNESWNLWELGEVHRVAGSTVEARRYYDEARALFDAQGNRFGLAYYERGLGDLALMAGDAAAAARRFSAARDLMADYPNEEWSLAYVLTGLARALAGSDRLDEAPAALAAAIVPIAGNHTPIDMETLVVAAAAEMALAGGRAQLGATLCALLAAHPLTWNETRARVAALVARARQGLGDDTTAAAEARGRLLDLHALIAGLAALPPVEAGPWLDAVARLVDNLPAGHSLA